MTVIELLSTNKIIGLMQSESCQMGNLVHKISLHSNIQVVTTQGAPLPKFQNSQDYKYNLPCGRWLGRDSNPIPPEHNQRARPLGQAKEEGYV